jgi:hypothetical protein
MAVPTLQRFGSVSMRMCADDHRPPHLHIVGSGFQAFVRISDLAAIAGEAPAARIVEPLAWVRNSKEMLALKCMELNERG